MSTVQNILNRTSVVADAARSTSTGTGFDAVLAGAIRDDRSATVDRRSQQPGREPVRAEQPDRARADRSDRSSRPDRTDRARTEKADRADRTNKNRTDRTGQIDRPATTDSTAPTDQKTTPAAADGTAAPAVTPVLTDPHTLVVAAPVETAPSAQLPVEASVTAADPAAVAPAVVAAAVPAAEPTATAPASTAPVAATAPTAEPATAPTTPAPSTPQPTTTPAEPVAPVAEPAVKSAPANVGPQPATIQATPAAAQPTAQSTTPAPVESASPTTATAPTTPVGPAVQVGSVALPTTAVTRESAAPLSDQLAGKLAEQLPGLKAAGPGRHTLSLTVTPEHFGKIQVVAHISAESVRVELVGATDAARDSLRAALPDLRRDLAQSGLSSDVRLGDSHAGTDPRGGQPGLTDSGRRSTGTATPGAVPGDQAAPSSESVPVRTASAAGGLDLLV